MNKLRVGVLMGGKSIEREVSFNSGRTVCDHLDSARYDIIPLYQTAGGLLYILPWRFLHRGKTNDFEHRLDKEAKKVSWDSLKHTIDFMYITTHGRYAEDGTLQGTLEVLQIPYLGSKVFASALGMDKCVQKDILRMHNIVVPRDVRFTPQQIESYSVHQIIDALHQHNILFPCIVKPHKEGSSLGISIVFDETTLMQALRKACYIHPGSKQEVLIEEKIEGMEFCCIILTDYKTGSYLPLPPTEVVPEPNTHIYDYDQKYMPGRAIKITPARCSTQDTIKIQQTCIKTMQALEFTNMIRVDGFFTTDGRVIIFDPNSLTGMAPASFFFRQAAEINMGHTQLINHIIETELHAYHMLAAIEQEEEKSRLMHNAQKIRVAVLMGGNSNEREISLESGRNVVYKLSPQTYEAIPVFVSDAQELYCINDQILVSHSTHEIMSRVTVSMKIGWSDLPRIADFVFIALHGGNGENGCVQGLLEMLDMPYNGSSIISSALCMDKHKTAQFLKSKGFEVPRSVLVARNNWHNHPEDVLALIFEKLPLPVIVKPHDDGCSVMVQKAINSEQLSRCLDIIFSANKTHALVEEMIQGMELTVGVVGTTEPRALPPSQAIAAGGILSIEEKFLPGAGENQTPAPLSESACALVQKTMQEVFLAAQCSGYARIDCFYQTAEQSSTKKERVIILEINSLPGLTPATCIFHQAAEVGIKPMDFIDMIIRYGFEHYKSTKNQKTDSLGEQSILKVQIVEQ